MIYLSLLFLIIANCGYSDVQRTVRPSTEKTTSGEILERPICVFQPLPMAITIEQHSSSYKDSGLTPDLISPKGDVIKLSDGSSWKVRQKDQKCTKRWHSKDIIIIETGEILNWLVYKLVNYTRNESIDVELIEPKKNEHYSRWIVEVCPLNGSMRLNDGSIWKINVHELLQWKEGDNVIIAVSKNLFSEKYSYVLINPRAKMRILAVFLSL